MPQSLSRKLDWGVAGWLAGWQARARLPSPTPKRTLLCPLGPDSVARLGHHVESLNWTFKIRDEARRELDQVRLKGWRGVGRGERIRGRAGQARGISTGGAMFGSSSAPILPIIGYYET